MGEDYFKDVVERLLAKANWINCTDFHVVEDKDLSIMYSDRKNNAFCLMSDSSWAGLHSRLLEDVQHILSCAGGIDINFNVVESLLFNE